jgi:hypothetical protein
MLDNTMAQNDGYVDTDYRAVTNSVPPDVWNALLHEWTAPWMQEKK